jgi:hypothetical protein
MTVLSRKINLTETLTKRVLIIKIEVIYFLLLTVVEHVLS